MLEYSNDSLEKLDAILKYFVDSPLDYEPYEQIRYGMNHKYLMLFPDGFLKLIKDVYLRADDPRGGIRLHS